MLKPTRKVLLIILDGFGIRADKEFNAIANAPTPNWDYYCQKYAFGAISASGEDVGLPKGQFGNSEVGHLNIGAGRIVQQDITRIDADIYSGKFCKNPALLNMLSVTTTGNVHILGLLSDGGVHSHIKHILVLVELANTMPNVQHVYVHVFLDGRDTPPRSALSFLQELNQTIHACTKASIATVSGRYYAMDRDQRYERVELAYRATVDGVAPRSASAIDVVNEGYSAGLSDEFIKPHIIGGYTGFKTGDSVVFANYRSDRAIQLTAAITNPEFNAFTRTKVSLASFVTMTNYDPKLDVSVAYPSVVIHDTLGEFIAKNGLHQLRIAETEKYPHVTYFFNGGRKEPYQNEDRVLVDSPRDVATYDLKPEMSLPEVTNKLVAAIKENKYGLIVTNFANGDMVGHSGDFAATVNAVVALDNALGKCIPEMLENGGEVLVIADHGNCETMFDKENNQVHTQHTSNLVPCLYIGRLATIRAHGSLQDVAPTVLNMLGLQQPSGMTGKNLIEFK